MVRGILGVIVGYIAMVIVVVAGLTVGYALTGADKAFQPNSYDVSTTWIAIWLIVGIVSAILGGFVCILISRSMTAPTALALIVLVLGLVMAIPQFTKSDADKPGPRTTEVGNWEAMADAQSPLWIAIANPVIGAIGVMIGAKLRGSRKTPKTITE